MSKGFFLGFLAASILWGAATAAYFLGYLDKIIELIPDSEEPVATEIEVESETAIGNGKNRKSLNRRQKRRRRGGLKRQRGKILGDDNLDDDGPNEIDMSESGGEGRLSPAQIDGAFGSAMPGIQRCLILLPPDQSGRGRVVFGLRIAGSGRVEGARLTGPSHLTSGEVGQCLRRQARALQFPQFDGPPMVANYPITFE